MEKGKENVRLTSGKRKYNIIPKIMCLAAAFVLWLYVMQIDSVDTESTFTGVRVYLENTSEIESRNGLFVYSGDGTLVNVTVTGRKSVINSYTSDDIRVKADLSGVTAAGIYDIKLSARLPNGLTLSGMSADTIPVYVDERDKKTLEVKAKLVSGTVAEGYELGELSPKYDNITVTGPKVALNDIDYAQIKLALGSIESSVTSVGQIELVSTSGESIDARYLQLSRTEMEVKVPLYTYKEVSLTAVSKYGYLTKENSVITVSPPKVTLKGDPTVLASIDSLTVATVDEKQLLGDSTL
ncbi:MAG: YbbR-like domain-containing protein, partial [Lachnospiraceae bacterium]